MTNQTYRRYADGVARWRWSLALLLMYGCQALAATVVYVGRTAEPKAVSGQYQDVAAFYGLAFRPIFLDNAAEARTLLHGVHDEQTVVAVVLNAKALNLFSNAEVLAFLQHLQPGTPLLIAGINTETDPALLRQWSSGTILECKSAKVVNDVAWFDVATELAITHQLSGLRWPLRQKEVFYLQEGAVGMRPILQAAVAGQSLPTFVHLSVGSQPVFFATESHPDSIPLTSSPFRQQAVFAAAAEPLMFLRYAGQERAWHAPSAAANLTIDDLWLRESYGHVHYRDLLQEAQKHNFHVTVAFIPWNFDRSQPEMVQLFYAHPERLSLCVHGNNHLHQEFGPLQSHPFLAQVKDAEQGLARMERFSSMTGLSYDPVMVFPHSISPEATFSALKKQNYWATINSLNVPSDAATPRDLDFALRTATLQFAAFPSLRRYSAESDIPTLQLAMDAFLGNPMLFYAHESFFVSGSDAFNRTADLVNRLQPETKWEGPGQILQHLYLEKLRDDGNYDIRSFSPSLIVSNPHGRTAIFTIKKAEDFTSQPRVLVDGQPYSFTQLGPDLQVQVEIATGASRLIEIRFRNTSDLAHVDITKSSARIALIRHLSDFRDNAVSTSALGRRFIHSYAESGTTWNCSAAAVAFLLFASGFRWRHNADGNNPSQR